MDIEALVQRAQVGDGEALSALVKIYQMPAPRVAQAILDNLHDAEDGRAGRVVTGRAQAGDATRARIP